MTPVNYCDDCNSLLLLVTGVPSANTIGAPGELTAIIVVSNHSSIRY